MSKKRYLTTPLYYVNDVPHIGHAYTTIAADIMARWLRLMDQDVFFLTGTDEHGAKIAKAAMESNQSPQEFVNRISGEYKRVWSILNISYDDFIQTSSDRHKTVVQTVFEKLKSTGDIYKGVYEDWYCIHDETYFTEKELIQGNCPSCGREVQRLKEETYFFRLSKYENQLLEYFEKNPEFLSPPFRANEIINFVKSGLRDLSVSRSRVNWGVPILSDPTHVIYVWFDALLNYVSVAGFRADMPHPMAPPFSQLWPADLHLVGKEIFRFHTVIWPAMLMALDIPLPKRVFAHGWWTVEGTKMSKSLGNVVNPVTMAEQYGVDAFRYFLFREVSFGADGDFSEKSLLNRYNSELANNLGNLLQRTTTLLNKNFSSEIPFKEKFSSQLLVSLQQLSRQINASYENLAFHEVLESIIRLLNDTNKFIDEKAPWKLAASQQEELAHILLECLSVLKVAAIFLYPFMPTKMQEMWQRLGEAGDLHFEGKRWLRAFLQGQTIGFASHQKITKGDPLFMRIGGRWK
jgi:methionyl-tRNA synthetase